jgi:CRISPR-associated endonuclease/helicase Cas3
MRTLVEQTRKNVHIWLERLHDEYGKTDSEENGLGWLATHSPVILMGGEDAGEWDLFPEHEAILIGTQDMLLSRALNRGYGMSRYRWPIHFGLLNNDCLWVMDEVQLMGPGLTTACQLEALRGTPSGESFPKGLGSIPAESVTWYLSATTNAEYLRTRDWRETKRPASFFFDLSDEEKSAAAGPIYDRRCSTKTLELQPERSFGEKEPPEEIIADILKRHEKMVAILGQSEVERNLPRRTIIICNTVDRAVRVHGALKDRKSDGCHLVLVHSRFRPPERRTQMDRLDLADVSAYPAGQIVVATQAIEAGVDLSSSILWSEVAPLSSLVQRLGRLNRAGEFNTSAWNALAVILGVGAEPAPARENKEAKEKREKGNAKRFLPYELASCEHAWQSLRKINGNGSPDRLTLIREDIAASIPRCPYSLQRHELLDFFDTDANLSLGFTDVSPFVRGLDSDTDVYVLWRDRWPQHDGKLDFFPDYQRDELCPVPIGKALAARHILEQGWLWRGKESGWISVRESGVAPGMTVLLPLSAGGYDNSIGWTGESEDRNHGSRDQPSEDAPDEELLSCLSNGWRSIEAHTQEVGDELGALLEQIFPGVEFSELAEALIDAVPWHDVGKNHPEWQAAVVDALQKVGIANKSKHQPFAKFSLSGSPFLRSEDGSPRLSGAELKREIKRLRHLFKPGLSHEIASALAFRQSEQTRYGAERPITSVLAEYLIMSHHGRVRKVLRDEIPRFPKDAKDDEIVRGIAQGTELPPVTIYGQQLGCLALSTDCRRMGRDPNGYESYTRGVLRLLETYGPFRLAFFEALFRAADVRASVKASREQNS